MEEWVLEKESEWEWEWEGERVIGREKVKEYLGRGRDKYEGTKKERGKMNLERKNEIVRETDKEEWKSGWIFRRYQHRNIQYR